MKQSTNKARRPAPDSPDYGQRVHISLRAAFSLINRSMKEGLYMPAYVTAFSIIEDRIFAMYVVAKRAVDGEQDVKRDYRVSLLKHTEYLAENKHIDKSLVKKIAKQFDLRNKRFHGAMWRLDEFTEKNTQDVIDMARLITDLRSAQRKKYGNGLRSQKM